MTTTLDQSNAALRAAVRERLDATPADDHKVAGSPISGGAYVNIVTGEPLRHPSPPLTEPRHIVASTEETQHDTHGYDAETLKAAADYMENVRAFAGLRGDSLLTSDAHPTSQAFYDLCDSLKEMHRLKSTDYGCPTGTDPLANIRNGAKFVGIPAWKGAMVRLSDKVTRLATFNATGSLTFEGVEDNLIDLASYALLSLLLYREEQDA